MTHLDLVDGKLVGIPEKPRKGVCSCESSPPGYVMEDNIHCGGCGGHFYGQPCEKDSWSGK
jgi:hypothetical protein